MNSSPGFSDLFVAANSGVNGIRIYTKIIGGSNKGFDSSITIHRVVDASNNPVGNLRTLEIVGNFGVFNSSNDYDTSTIKLDPQTDILSHARAFGSSFIGSMWHLESNTIWPTTGNFPNYNLEIMKRNFRGNTFEPADAVEIDCTKESTGIYKASFKIANNIQQDTLYEMWRIPTGANNVTLNKTTGLIRGYQGSSPVSVKSYKDVYDGSGANIDKIASIQNLKPSYKSGEKSQLNVIIKNKLNNPNVYSKVTDYASPDYFDNVYYQIKRVTDDLIIVPFSTGSAVNFSGLSYNEKGCNFLLDTNYLQERYLYEISFCCEYGNQKSILNEKFRFRVE